MRPELPVFARSQARAVRFHSYSPTNPAGGWRSPRSVIATPSPLNQVDRIEIPFASATVFTATQVAFVAAGSGTVAFAHTYVPSPRSKRTTMPAEGLARAGTGKN